MDLAWIGWLLDSYALWLKQELIDRSGDTEAQSERLFFAPFVVVSHLDSEDPILNYGNRRALDLWEMTWPEFTATPSRLTAEPMNRDERARTLRRVAAHGFVDDYKGVRISRTGHFTLGHILAPPWWPTYVDATGSSDPLSLWERVGVRVPQ